MNLKRIERHFTRAWANAAAKLGRALPELVSLAESETPTYDVIATFKGSVQNAEDAFRLTGATVFSAAGPTAALILPAGWVGAPSRLFLPETPLDRLHNALLDAGIADWIELSEADDTFIVELLDTTTLGQLDALKSRYDIAIPSPDMPICTLRERFAIDPANVETMLRVRWGGAHAGKIDAIEHTNDPREFVVVTRKPVPLAARLADHGIQQKQQIEPTRIHVRIMDALWEKIEAAHRRNGNAGAPLIDPVSILDPFAPPLDDVECSADLLVQFYNDSKSRGVSVNMNAPHVIAEYDALVRSGYLTRTESPGWVDYQMTDDGEELGYHLFYHENLYVYPPLPDPTPEPPPLDERDLLIADLKTALIGKDALIGALKSQLAALHVESTEWQTLRLPVSKDGRITAHPEIAEQEAFGWRVHTVTFAANGEDKLFVLMKRDPKRQIVFHPVETARVNVTASNGWHGETIIIPEPPRSPIADAMIREMDADIAPLARAFVSGLERTGVFGD